MSLKAYKRISAIYFFTQGILILLWWVFIILKPEHRNYFLPPGVSEILLLSFWLADISLAGVGSLISCAIINMKIKSLNPVLWFVAGAVGYAALFSVGLSILTQGGWWTAGIMLIAFIFTIFSSAFGIKDGE